jgi:hypothetical protein
VNHHDRDGCADRGVGAPMTVDDLHAYLAAAVQLAAVDRSRALALVVAVNRTLEAIASQHRVYESFARHGLALTAVMQSIAVACDSALALERRLRRLCRERPSPEERT